MSSKKHFDYIIIGNGMAGLQLALALSKDAYFENKRIALIDKAPKSTNDKTWCFWEKGKGQWDSLVYKGWKIAHFQTSKKHLNLKLHPYGYKMLRSIDFYNEAKSTLSKNKNIHFIIDDVILVEEVDDVEVSSSTNTYSASHVFDSRINNDFSKDNLKHTKIIQHFKGWIIATKESTFNPDAFTMMDYRIKDGEQTSFTYVLPLSKNKALVEFTYFTANTVSNKVYDTYLKQYVSDILKIDNYEIIETEEGNIPMTSFPFGEYSTKHITKIGTAGGWVKGSTGYSFKLTEKKVSKIIDNIKQGKTPSNKLTNERFRFYDKVFLKVLLDENSKGEWIFERFYTKNSVETMFRFLDEESNLWEELKIMYSLFSFTFIKAFFKTL